MVGVPWNVAYKAGLHWSEEQLSVHYVAQLPARHSAQVRLTKVIGGCYAEIVCKMETMEPCCSVKDRIALAMIESAEQRGVISPDRTTLVRERERVREAARQPASQALPVLTCGFGTFFMGLRS